MVVRPKPVPLVALAPNVGTQGRKLLKAAQAKQSNDASKKRIDFEKEAARAEERLVNNKRKQTNAQDKRNKKQRKASPKAGQFESNEVDGRYWGARPGAEEEIPELNGEGGPFKGEEGPQQEDEEGSLQDAGA